jgi:hypothetical protein
VSKLSHQIPRIARPLAVLALLAVPSSADAAVKSFRPVQHTSTTATFRVVAVTPTRITSARVVSRRGETRLSVTSLRRALRRTRLVRTPLPRPAAHISRKQRRRPRTPRLVLVLRSPTAAAKRPAAGKTSPTKATPTSNQPSPSGSGATGGRKIQATSLPEISTACGFGSFGPNSLPGACWRPYSDASPFNQPLPANPPLADASAANVATITVSKPQSPVVGVADTSEDYYHPYYFSAPDDPVFTVHCTESWGTCDVEGLQVRIPDAARAAGAGDGHLAVIDQANGWEYDFWQVHSKPRGGGRLDISWGGRTRIGTPDADGLGSNATAGHYGLLAGIIRYPEIAAGQIDHALFMSVKCTNGQKVFPAGSSGSGCGGTNAPPMGSRFFLDMSDAQIDALDVPAWRKPVLRAMAHYGMFVGDTGGPSWAIAIESSSTYTSYGMPDPWVAFAKAQPDSIAWQNKYYLPIGDGIDWARYLKVAAPCVTQRSC